MHSKLLDKVKLIGLAFGITILLLGSFWLADIYRVDFIRIFATWMALAFLVTVGWDLRSKIRNPGFVPFFLAWLGVHTALVAVVIGSSPWYYWLPLFTLELWVGYLLAFWLFGPPDRRDNGK